MLSKNFLISFIAVFIFIALWELVIWGVILTPIIYPESTETALVTVMGGNALWIQLIHALLAYVFVRIFIHYTENKGIGEGVRYGLLAGVLFATINLYNYFNQLVTLKNGLIAFGADVLLFMVAGAVLATVYKAVGESKG